MPIPAQDPEISYVASGGTVFPFPFKVQFSTDFKATVNGTVSTDYILSGLGLDAGGNCTFNTAPVNGAVVVLSRVVPYNRQLYDYQPYGDFQADTVDADIDRLVMQIQQLSTQLKRTIGVPVGQSLTLGLAVAPEASKFLRWASDALSITNVDIATFSPASIAVSAYIQTLLDDADAATARATLGTFPSLGANVASAAILPVNIAGYVFSVTGTTAITSIASKGAGTVIVLQFTGILTLTHHATNLILPTGANITTYNGYVATFVEYGAGTWRWISGLPVVPTTTTLQVITATGANVWTKPAGLIYAVVEVQGAGAAGGGAGATIATQASAGSGGGAGGFSRKKILAAALGATETATVGAGGTGVSNGTGNTGGASSFGAHATANGGVGGIVVAAGTTQTGGSGGTGGTAASGDLNIQGGAGHVCMRQGTGDATNEIGWNGQGGDAVLGAGGKATATATTAAGSAGTLYGGGGAGAANAGAGQSNIAGAAGANGIILVWEFYA